MAEVQGVVSRTGDLVELNELAVLGGLRVADEKAVEHFARHGLERERGRGAASPCESCCKSLLRRRFLFSYNIPQQMEGTLREERCARNAAQGTLRKERCAQSCGMGSCCYCEDGLGWASGSTGFCGRQGGETGTEGRMLTSRAGWRNQELDRYRLQAKYND